MFEADRHNFGKCVERIERASGHWYRKPRSVYWEHLFFGQGSPIKSFFNSAGPNGDRPLSEYLFNLNVEVKNDWLGFSEEVSGDEIPISIEHFYSFGVLVGYCYLLGIRDLHKYNLVVKKNHLQIIDAEVVLTNLILPNETILLPFREIPFDLSAVSLLCSNLKKLSVSQIEKLFSGYFDVTTAILDSLNVITPVLEHECRNQHPARVILKNTKQYRDFLMGSGSANDYLPEELVQLDRGDIPYFFKYVGQTGLYFLSEPDVVETVSKIPSDLDRDVRRHSKSPALLLQAHAAVAKKVATGALYLRRALGSDAPIHLQDTNGEIALKDSSLSFRDQSFSTSPRAI